MRASLGSRAAVVCALALLAVAAAGCLAEREVRCGEDRICAEDRVCDLAHHQCISPAQRRTCADQQLAEGAPCPIAGRVGGGVCTDGVCLGDVCGDLRATGLEQCDGDDLKGATDCRSIGLHGAEAVACHRNCTYDVAACAGSCGDGVVQPGDEDCDGADLAGQSCLGLGFHGGALGCQSNCRLDRSGCDGRCGDGVVTLGEVCDSRDFGGKGCPDFGRYTGGLRCSAGCDAIDTAACTGYCGDGVRNGTEVCDGADVGPVACESFGWHDGTMRCNADCSGLDAGGCSGYCGDGVVDGGEQCDGVDQAGETCSGMGAQDGALRCDAFCRTATDLCHWGRWRRVASATTKQLLTVWGAADDDVWAAGRDGVLLHHDGLGWQAAASGTTADIQGLWGSAADDVWAATADGALHYDGVAWGTVEELAVPLRAVWGTAADDVWAAGDCMVAHFDGRSWRQEELDCLFDEVCSITQLWGSGRDDVWGGCGEGAMHYDGTGWRYAGREVGAVWGTGPDDVWGLGHEAGIVHRDGAAWSPVDGTSDVWAYGIWGTERSDVWVMSLTGLMHYDGRAWSTSVEDVKPQAIWGTGAGDVWAVGDDGAIWHQDGPGWTEVPTASDASLFAVWTVGPADTWVFGNRVVLHHDGIAMRVVDPGIGLDNALTALWGSGADDIWAVGWAGSIAHFDGRVWERAASPTGEDLHDIWGSAADDVWAVGFRTILHNDGGGWQEVRSDQARFDHVWAGGPKDVWVTGSTWGDGGHSFAAHFDGSQWKEIATQVAGAIWGSGRDDVWIMDGRGTMAHYDGVALQPIALATSSDFNDVWGSGADDVWAVARGQAWHYDGRSWQPFGAVATRELISISGTAADNVWAVSLAGKVTHLGHAAPRLQGGACAAPSPLYCQSSTTGVVAASLANAFSRYGCATGELAGGEVTYRLENPIGGRLTVTLTPRRGDLELIAVGADGRDACDPAGRCRAAAHAAAAAPAVITLDEARPGETLYLIVDGAAGAETGFGLEVACEKRLP